MFKIIELDKIVSGKNIRNERDEEINDLAKSIEENGLINPIFVKPLDNGKFEVIAGHRRFEACKECCWFYDSKFEVENESDPKIKELEKENAELKEKLKKETAQRIYNFNKSIEWKEKHRGLEEAKAEQFLWENDRAAVM